MGIFDHILASMTDEIGLVTNTNQKQNFAEWEIHQIMSMGGVNCPVDDLYI